MFNYRSLIISALAFGSVAWGHIDSLKINGNLVGIKTASFATTDSFTIGQSIDISFAMKVVHNGTTIYFRASRDNGATWTPIGSSTTFNTVATHTLNWVVTGPASSQVLIRVFHSASPGAEGMVPNDYTLISGRFTINSPSSLRPADFANSLTFRQTPSAIQIGGAGIGSRVLRIEISDTRGALLHDSRMSGNGAISIPTLGLSQGRVFIRVLSGEKSLANRALMIRH